MDTTKKLIANPIIVLREEFDDWAFLFNPDTTEMSIIDPVGAFIWKMLDGYNGLEDILRAIKSSFSDVPDDAINHLASFIKQLEDLGLAGCERDALDSDRSGIK
jgi:SynChlorMet cassette protein ScmD